MREGVQLVQTSQNTNVGDLEIRFREHILLAKGRPVPLTTREFDIVAVLAQHPGWVFSTEQLSGDSEDGEFSPESVSVLISRIRQKLSAADVFDAVETVRGLGYRLHALEALGDDPDLGVDAELRDAWWHLQEAVIEVSHAGTAEQQRDVGAVLEQARRAIYSDLAE